MITAILLGFLGLFLGMVGLRCTNVGNIDLSVKVKMLAIAGTFHILAGNEGVGGAWVREALATAPGGFSGPPLLLSSVTHLLLLVDPCCLLAISPCSLPCLYSANL